MHGRSDDKKRQARKAKKHTKPFDHAEAAHENVGKHDNPVTVGAWSG